MPRAVFLVGGTLFAGLVSFLMMTTAGVALSTVWALLVGVASVLFVKLVDESQAIPSGAYIPVVVAGAAIGMGWLLAAASGAPTVVWPALVGVGLAGASAVAMRSLGRPKRTQLCSRCKRLLDSHTALHCPRCHRPTCAQPACWSARHFRCQRCDEQEIVLFPVHNEQWWTLRVGPRIANGTCGHCKMEAHEADLRECGRCRWPMCKRCWDLHNGQCARCEWMMPDLPQELYAVMGTAADGRRRTDAGRVRRA